MEIKQVETENYLEQIEQLAKVIWKEHYIPIIGSDQVSYMLKKFESISNMKNQINEGYQYYIFMDSGEAIGYMAFTEIDNSIFLSKLYIAKEYRGRGFSKQAFEYVITVCKELNKKNISLTCNKHNTSTLQAYKRLGFKIVREQVTEIGIGYVMDDYVLEKVI